MHSWPTVSLPTLPGEGLEVRLHDSATGELEPVAPGDPARLYVCGITPYDATHLGHANTYVGFDLLVRALHDSGHDVHYVENVTDVDDPLLERAAATSRDWRELATEQMDLFREDMTALRVVPPTYLESVSEAMGQIIDAVKELIDSGAAYQVDDDWYFDISHDDRFGLLSADMNDDQRLAIFGERGGDPDRPGKRHPLDCLLWRAERAGEPSWEAPFGAGRPGWHIECVAIAKSTIDTGFDVQAGGSDLVFPHHDMSASLGHVLTEEWPYARHWMHSGMVAYQGEKMSKSLGNLVLVSALRREGRDPVAIRLMLLAHHYRSDWEYTPADLEAAERRLTLWREALAPPTGPPAERTLTAVRKALADDLNAPIALAAVDRWVVDQRVRGGDDPAAPGVIARMLDALLGVAL